MNQTLNPLTQPSTLKHAAIPFDQIRTEHYLPALKQAITHGQSVLEQIRQTPLDKANFQNSIKALEDCTEELEAVYSVFSNVLIANGNDEMQALSMQMGPEVASFVNDILLDEKVFARVKRVYEQRQSHKLSAEQTRLVEKTYEDFERSGGNLSAESKVRLRAIDESLSQLQPKFRDNVLKATNAFELWIENESDLKGLPPSQVTAAREAALAKEQKDKWLFTLQRPSYGPFLTFAENRALRERMYRAFSSTGFGGTYDNRPVLLEIAGLMQEKAKLLGHPSFASYALKQRMAESPENVTAFLSKIGEVAKPAALRELTEIQSLAKEMGGPDQLEPWDLAYYAERLKEKRYAFDEEQLRPYLKLENVVNGVFEHARRLFGLKFELKTKDYPTYHPEVNVYEVFKETSKEFIGLFYTDFFPRASKSGGAWMTNFREQGGFRGKVGRPHVSIVCNFSKPSADTPSLLNFDEVRTLFHEFGHALHGLLSKVEHRSLAGTNVYLDFVELPSQFLENWAEEEESLKLFAHHYQTGELIPMRLVEALQRSQLFMVGYHAMRQLNFANLDLAWFTKPPGKDADVAKFEEEATRATHLMKRIEGANISTSFGHIFGGGYASGYYSYKWAEALEADAFELFKEKGIFDQEAAQKFEEFILSKGGSDHPMRLYEKFRGRTPDPEALLRRDGLLNGNSKTHSV